ncbi:MAG: hypothetical protein ACTSUL_07360 [Promethearchaeota archaeon]
MRYKSNNHSHKLMIISLVVIFLIISLNALNLTNNILYKAKNYRNSENITILNTLALSSDKISVGGAIIYNELINLAWKVNRFLEYKFMRYIGK